jgi:hypothetical protein
MESTPPDRSAAVGHQAVADGHLANMRQAGPRRGDEPPREELVDGGGIQLDAIVAAQQLDQLGAPQHGVSPLHPIAEAKARAVACNHQPLGWRIPDRHRRRTVELAEAFRSLFAIEIECQSRSRPARFLDLGGVENLAVDDGEGAVGVLHGVDVRQPGARPRQTPTAAHP